MGWATLISLSPSGEGAGERGLWITPPPGFGYAPPPLPANGERENHTVASTSSASFTADGVPTSNHSP